MMHCFVRVNGDTVHNDRANRACFVNDLYAALPGTYFNGLQFCLQHDIVRIGWPDTGDLGIGGKASALCRCYDLNSINPLHKDYLLQFRAIPVGSTILMPDKDHPGYLYIGDVFKPYHYVVNVPSEPYEHAHRLGVHWDTDEGGPVAYQATQLGISIHGGFWRRAFFKIDPQYSHVVSRIQSGRGRPRRRP